MILLYTNEKDQTSLLLQWELEKRNAPLFARQFLQTLYLIGSKQIPPAEARKMVEAIHPNHFQNELHLV